MSRRFVSSSAVLVLASLLALPVAARAQLPVASSVATVTLTGGTGSEACSANASSCGSNVSRNANTNPKECKATYSNGHSEMITCPPGFSQSSSSSSSSSSSGSSGSGSSGSSSSSSSNTQVKKP